MRIAIIRLSAMGDIIMSSVFLAALKELNKDCEIDFFVDSDFSGIVEHSPCIKKIHSMPFKKNLKSLGGISKIREFCKNCGFYDVVIDMQGLFKSALVGSFLQKKHFVGFDYNSAREGFASFFYNKKVKIAYEENILKRNFKVLFDYFAFSDMQKALQLKTQSLGVNYLSIDEKIEFIFKSTKGSKNFLFVLESSNPKKQYNIKNFFLLAQMLHKFLKHCNIFLIFYNDENSAVKLLTNLKKIKIDAYLLPKMNLNAVKYCINQMDCVIGGDTGVTHLAWAFDINSITLYGDTNDLKHSYKRVLLGNPFVVANNKNYEIDSIPPREIFEVYKSKIFKEDE